MEKILRKLNKYGNESKRYAHALEEEQEMEIEAEIEKEEVHEVEDQTIYEFYDPKVSKELKSFVKSGNFKKSSCFIHLPDSLNNTSLKDELQNNAWNPNLYVTEDFIRTVEYPFCHDEILRPPKWIVMKDDVAVIIR